MIANDNKLFLLSKQEIENIRNLVLSTHPDISIDDLRNIEIENMVWKTIGKLTDIQKEIEECIEKEIRCRKEREISKPEILLADESEVGFYDERIFKSTADINPATHWWCHTPAIISQFPADDALCIKSNKSNKELGE